MNYSKIWGRSSFGIKGIIIEMWILINLRCLKEVSETARIERIVLTKLWNEEEHRMQFVFH